MGRALLLRGEVLSFYILGRSYSSLWAEDSWCSSLEDDSNPHGEASLAGSSMLVRWGRVCGARKEEAWILLSDLVAIIIINNRSEGIIGVQLPFPPHPNAKGSKDNH